eukprot:1251436-Pyramimonas_sp.AAC.1
MASVTKSWVCVTKSLVAPPRRRSSAPPARPVCPDPSDSCPPCADGDNKGARNAPGTQPPLRPTPQWISPGFHRRG